MGQTLLVVALIVFAVLIFQSVMKRPRFQRAALSAVPVGNYLRAREKGASAEDAVFDSIQVLRYRAPWSGLSDADLKYASAQLGSLPDPSVFASLIVEVEQSRDLRAITDRNLLDRFVRGARAAAQAGTSS